MDRDTLREALKREGYKFQDYFELIRSSSETRELIEREIRPKVTISEDDIKNYFYNHYTKNAVIPKLTKFKSFQFLRKATKPPLQLNRPLLRL